MTKPFISIEWDEATEHYIGILEIPNICYISTGNKDFRSCLYSLADNCLQIELEEREMVNYASISTEK